MQPYEIFLGSHQWMNCSDKRPWLIVGITERQTLRCFPISGVDYQGKGFEILISHPDFPATGLTKTSVVHDEYFIELRTDELIKRRGELVNNLLKEFLKFSGI